MGHSLKIKCIDSRVNVHTLASKSVPFTLTTVQVPNLSLTHKKRITVCMLTLKPNADKTVKKTKNAVLNVS
jgi:hypothetical protein